MKLKSTLVRLQNALGWDDVAERLVLSYGTPAHEASAPSADQDMNVVIGYNGSPNSQVALDLALWIAYQSRLATSKKVLVHVVYVVDRRNPTRTDVGPGAIAHQSPFRQMLSQAIGIPALPLGRRRTDVHASVQASAQACLTVCEPKPSSATQSLLDQADCILWQARCLAEEWRGSLEAHLRFGHEDEELLQVASDVNADLVVLGCSTPEHRLVKKVANQMACPILGIPPHLEAF